jgi:F-type H+-transporting ATPase subunit gamma
MLSNSRYGFKTLHNIQKANFGVNEKVIKVRMKSVGNIQKITKAMKMVAASKMKADLTRLDAGKDFGIRTVQNVFANESYLQKKKQDSGPAKKTLVVPITSDKGLCGGVNSGIVREVKTMVMPNRQAYRIFVIGEKGTAALIRPFPELLLTSVSELLYPVNFTITSSIAHQITYTAEEEQCDGVVIVYNEFKSAISTVIRTLEIQSRKQFGNTFKHVVRHDTEEPDKDFSKHYYYELYVAGQFYHAMLQNAASEQSARMNAMENASKNAKEMLDKLSLTYNKARQARITMELVEIISGANAL